MTSLVSDVLDLREMDSVELAHLCGAKQQDSELWTEFLRRFTPKIKSFIRSTLRQRGNAGSAACIDSNQESDLFQNTILRLVKNNCAALKRFSGTTESELMLYFAVIARSTVRDSVRHQSAKRRFHWFASPDVYTDESGENCEFVREPGVENSVEREILAREIEQLSFKTISSSVLPIRDKLIFQLYFYEGLSAAQIASCNGIGLSKTGIEKIINRLKEKVRRAASVHPMEARP
jgi:RNA polymerase sigma factor (sigma-70 family)